MAKMEMKRKIIQIAMASGGDEEATIELLALCDDGSLWIKQLSSLHVDDWSVVNVDKVMQS